MRRLLVILGVLAAAMSACDSENEEPSATATVRADVTLPTPVTIASEPADGFTLGDPALEALPGGTTNVGRIGGMNYQIEVPDDWNGRLVMYAHGNDQDVELQVYPPVNRGYLIDHGYAWASSSYSVNVTVVTGVASDETAAVWDHFVKTYGRPEYTYVMGDSMGGSVAFLSAERYPDRYDGSLPLCGDVDAYAVQGDFFTAAAFVAGVTAAEWEASGEDVGLIIDARLRPMLRDETQRARFIALWSDLSGGERPFVDEGVARYQEGVWTYVIGNLVQDVYNNAERTYELSSDAGVTSADFNEGVLRIAGTPGADKYEAINTVTGDIGIPTLTVHTTGDALTIFNQQQEMHRLADEKGKDDLLVQRAIQSPRHCFDDGLSSAEVDASLEALVGWVERGEKPAGESLTGDITNVGAAFTLIPRVGSAAADAVAGADQRLAVSGSLTFNGEPVRDGYLWADVITEGRRRSCSHDFALIDAGQYRLSVAADAETAGCGAAGAMLEFAYFKDGVRYATDAVAWPETGTTLTADLAFVESELDDQSARGTYYSGSLLNESGEPPLTGTVVEAYVGDVLCGTFSVPPIKLVFDDGQSYNINIAHPSAIAGCTEGSPISFRIDGAEVEAEGVHDLTDHTLDLRP